MKIGFDAKRAVNNMTGLGNYSRLVIESLARRFPADRMLLYAPGERENARLQPILALPNVELHTPVAGGLFAKGALWRSWGICGQLKADSIDIFHGLSNELPLNIRQSGIPSVVTVHDLIFRRLPYCYSLPDRHIYNLKYGASCRLADRIIAISQRTKDDIVELFGINPDKIDIVYQGCAETFKHTATRNQRESVRQKYGLPQRYVLQVGTIERRKNLMLTVKALSALPADVHLVAVGRDRGYLEGVMAEAARTGVAERIHILSGVAFDELPAIYQQAAVIAYPSRYEGFGIPVLEGLESERPVVAATGSCLEEAGGEAAFYVSPDSPRQMAEALNAALAGGPAIVSRIGLGKRHASRFNNSDIAGRLADVYARTLEQTRPKHS